MGVPDLGTIEERREATEPARRAARYRHAENRIRQIVDGAPPLTAEQRENLALLLHPGAGNADAG
jgi:hypothetical protein